MTIRQKSFSISHALLSSVRYAWLLSRNTCWKVLLTSKSVGSECRWLWERSSEWREERASRADEERWVILKRFEVTMSLVNRRFELATLSLRRSSSQDVFCYCICMVATPSNESLLHLSLLLCAIMLLLWLTLALISTEATIASYRPL